MGKNDEANRSWLRVNRSFPPSNEVVFFHQAAKSTNYIFIYSTMRHTARDDSHGHDAGYTWCTHARSRRFIISLREYRLKPELVIIIRVIIYECKEGGNTSLVTLIKEDKEIVDRDQVYRRVKMLAIEERLTRNTEGASVGCCNLLFIRSSVAYVTSFLFFSFAESTKFFLFFITFSVRSSFTLKND